jgi:hypothetical protein
MSTWSFDSLGTPLDPRREDHLEDMLHAHVRWRRQLVSYAEGVPSAAVHAEDAGAWLAEVLALIRQAPDEP